MKLNLKVSSVVVFGVVLSMILPQFLSQIMTKNLKEEKKEITYNNSETKNNEIVMAEKKDTGVPVKKEEAKEEVKIEEQPVEPVKEEKIEVVEQPKQEEVKIIPYEEMSTEDLINSIANGSFKMELTKEYDTNTAKLSKARGALHYNNHKETYYSEKKLPGTSLNIPGRHVAEDGTIRDAEGYICVAANSSYLSKGTVVKTSMGPGKVYDAGCASGIVDIYTNW